MNTAALEELRAFRHQFYRLFGCRRDALFELLDAVLTAPTIETPAHLSLVPSCQRGWGSLYDALNAGTMEWKPLEHLIASYPMARDTAWYAVDASVWPRCDAETSPARGYYAHPYRHSHGQPIVAGWTYSWLVQLPSRCSSGTAPLRVRRGFSHLLAQAGTPATIPKPCGISPGRPKGTRSPPAVRFPAVKLTP